MATVDVVVSPKIDTGRRPLLRDRRDCVQVEETLLHDVRGRLGGRRRGEPAETCPAGVCAIFQERVRAGHQ